MSYYGQGDYYHSGDTDELYSADTYDYMGDPGFWGSIGNFFKSIAKPVLAPLASLIPGVGGLLSGLITQFAPDPAQPAPAAHSTFSQMNAGGGIINSPFARGREAEAVPSTDQYEAEGYDEEYYDPEEYEEY